MCGSRSSEELLELGTLRLLQWQAVLNNVVCLLWKPSLGSLECGDLKDATNAAAAAVAPEGSERNKPWQPASEWTSTPEETRERLALLAVYYDIINMPTAGPTPPSETTTTTTINTGDTTISIATTTSEETTKSMLDPATFQSCVDDIDRWVTRADYEDAVAEVLHNIWCNDMCTCMCYQCMANIYAQLSLCLCVTGLPPANQLRG